MSAASPATLLGLLAGGGLAAVLALALAGSGPVFLVAGAASWGLLWAASGTWSRMAGARHAWGRLAPLGVPLLFGATLLLLWELVCTGLGVPSVLLPAPSVVASRIAASVPMLAADFVQTVLRAAIPGWAMGSLAGFAVALLCDRFDSVRRGLMPIASLVSALPVIGIAPILVMWFGFDWQSKAAVVVVMTFFPMLVGAVAGLQAAGAMERDLMRSYGASWGQTLLALRLPAAMPFLFNALKINASLAMIGAIVAEFFGTPVLGMGFRISTEIGRMALDTVWATIAVAAVAGSGFHGLLVLAERRVTFWHASVRRADE